MAEKILGGSYKLVNGERVRNESVTQTTPQTLGGENVTNSESEETSADDEDEHTRDGVIEEIKAVIPSVHDDGYTMSGKPMVEAIEEILGRDITESQRDVAWYEYKQENES